MQNGDTPRPVGFDLLQVLVSEDPRLCWRQFNEPKADDHHEDKALFRRTCDRLLCFDHLDSAERCKPQVGLHRLQRCGHSGVVLGSASCSEELRIVSAHPTPNPSATMEIREIEHPVREAERSARGTTPTRNSYRLDVVVATGLATGIACYLADSVGGRWGMAAVLSACLLVQRHSCWPRSETS